MVMPISVTFHYRVQIKPSSGSGSRTWIGEVTTLQRSDNHPGLVGYRPRFELSNGRVTLRSTECHIGRRSRQKRRLKALRSAGSRSVKVSVTSIRTCVYTHARILPQLTGFAHRDHM
jgi:hypothetical protein